MKQLFSTAFYVICFISTAEIHASYAFAKPSKKTTTTADQPLFISGKKARKLIQSTSRNGLAASLDFIPYFSPLSTGTTVFLPRVRLFWDGKHIALTGRAELHSSESWIAPYKRNPFFAPLSSEHVSDRGSSIQLMYRWKSKSSWFPWDRRIGLAYYPFSNQQIQLGEGWELLTPRISQANNVLNHIGTWGFFIHWDWIRAWVMFDLQLIKQDKPKQPGWENARSPSILGEIRVAPWKGLRIWVQGYGFSSGTTRTDSGNSLPYDGWGIHAGGRVFFGKHQPTLAFLHRRRRDPRSAVQPLPSLPTRSQTGIALFGEFGMREHGLPTPNTPTIAQSVIAMAFRAGVSAHGYGFQATAGFLLRDYRWVDFFSPSVPATFSRAVVKGIWQGFLSVGTLIVDNLSLGFRLDLVRPGEYATAQRAGSRINIDATAIYRANQTNILPRNKRVMWTMQGTLQARWDIWEWCTLVAEFWLFSNGNKTKEKHVSGPSTLESAHEWMFGSELLLYLRF